MARETVTVPKGLHAELCSAGLGPAERHLALVLTTSGVRVGIGHWGIFRASPATLWALNQPGVTHEWVEKAFEGLRDREWLVAADGWVFVPSILVRDQPRTDAHIKGALRDLAKAPKSSTVWISFLNVAQLHAIPLYEALERQARGSKLSSSMPIAAGGGRPPRGSHPTPTGGPAGPSSAWGSTPMGGGTQGAPRLKGTPAGVPEGVRNSTDPDEAPRVDLSRSTQGGGSSSPSSAEPHGNAPGGDARTTRHDKGEAADA